MHQFEEITFDTPPVMLAAWPGMGNVGLITVDYFRRKIGGKIFAEIDMSPYFIPDSIVVKDGLAVFPEIPTSVFYYMHNPNLIIFESNAQISGKDGIAIIKTILEIAARFNIQRIFTSAAFAQPMSYRDDSKVLGACNTRQFADFVNQYGVLPMPDGYIAGLNGLLLGVAASRKIDASCLLGTIPSYATNLSYPKASREIIKMLQKILRVDIDMAEMDEAIGTTELQMGEIEDRIREFFPALGEGGGVSEDGEMVEPEHVEDEKVPQYIMDKIEKLFMKARADKKNASELKKELDRWKLFSLYENRFLDLFEDDMRKKSEK